MTAARARTRPEPVRDLFEQPTRWTPPKEFTDYLAARGTPLAPAPGEPPAPTPAPAPARAEPAAPTRPGRNFTAAIERVQDGDHLVVRERIEHGHQIYRAYEKANVFFHHVTIDELTWGRIDTRRLGDIDPYGGEHVQRQMANAAESRAVIRRLCPETRRAAADLGIFIYDGPGYVLLTVDPEARYQAARAREVPP